MAGEINSLVQLGELVRSGKTDFSEHGDVRTFIHDGMIGFDYTPLATYAGRWNWLERVSRGLVLDIGTGHVLAKPYEKFFNIGELDSEPQEPLTSVTDKADGSLGIIFKDTRGDWRVNTRGSFASEQAQWATENWLPLLKASPLAKLDVTILGEIVYPENRIVVDYSLFKGIILHGLVFHNAKHSSDPSIDLKTVADVIGDHPARGIYTSSCVSYDLPTVSEVRDFIEGRSAVEAEGVVVTDADGVKFKMKSTDYLELHRLVTDVTKLNIFENMRDGKLEERKANVPDEFLPIFEEFESWVTERRHQWRVTIECVYSDSPSTEDDKAFAEWVNSSVTEELAPAMFMMRKGVEVGTFIDKRIREEIRAENRGE